MRILFLKMMTTNDRFERKRLGNSDLQITPVGLGAWAIGGEWAFGWGAQDDDESIAAIRHALDLGINWIDTAAAYGLGHSEEVVARALRDIPAGERPYVFTKCGLVDGGIVENISGPSIRRELEDSLRRLAVETIDLYQIHWPTDRIEDIDDAWNTMSDLVHEGKIRYIGVSNFSVDEMERARRVAPITSLQPPYSLINRDVETSILPYCKEHGIGVIVYSPMGSGLLSGRMTRERAAALPASDWRSRNEQFQEPKLSRTLELVDLLGEIAAESGHTAAEAAIAWTLSHDAVTAAIVGARSPAQVDGWIGAATYRLSAQERARINRFLERP